ncbi:hypothetical protein CON42_08375 [Bacillus thuringiensis]|uniref:ParB N-terminal domain-containing protein n=1 Tax=Bacillus thuringiensis TaxID=1428 RepID=UPI000BEBFFF5|nr:ParB N-terminal domain-containing protein [Bacillus thuringiensis]MED3053019.1 ParB N-terminal domain-containing protein [Bacillus thuringiensis]PEA16649.1 hypothetical protein CON42_08375 [Bacillus thuringiensis]PFH77303.1 hypothetical protein COI56_06200 [Bacillus thuringiensis]
MIENLKFIPINHISFFTPPSKTRVDKLIRSIATEKVLYNLPVALRIEEDQYLILDGKHRTLALMELGCQNILVQLVKESNLSLQSTLHQGMKNRDNEKQAKQPKILYLFNKTANSIEKNQTKNEGMINFILNCNTLIDLYIPFHFIRSPEDNEFELRDLLEEFRKKNSLVSKQIEDMEY